MNHQTLLRRGAIALSLCAVAVSAAQAQSWTSNVYSFADCNASDGSSGQGPSASNACSTTDASAHAETTFTSMKAAVSASTTAAQGNYYAGNIIQDSVLATAVDPALAGTAGTLRFSVAFDGQMSAQTSLYFAAHRAYVPAGYGGFSLDNLPLTTNFFGEPRTVHALSTFAVQARAVDALASWELPVVFGQSAHYQVGWTIYANAPGASADFSHTWTLVGLDAFDVQGQAVAAGFSAASGAVLPAAPVPEPQALLLMLAGLAGLAVVQRRRHRG